MIIAGQMNVQNQKNLYDFTIRCDYDRNLKLTKNLNYYLDLNLKLLLYRL